MVIALASVMLIIWLIEAGTDAPAETVDAGEKEIDWILMAISIAFSLLFCGVGIVVHTILHEAGHLLFGLATGYKFVSFRIFNRMIAKEKDGLKVRKFSIVGTMGQCVMEPPCHTEQVPFFWYNAGGVAMNILLTAVAILLLRSYDLEIVPMSALLMIAFTGMLMAVIIVGLMSLRKNRRTSIAKRAPRSRSLNTELITTCMYSPWSIRAVNFRFSCSSSSFLNFSLMLSATVAVA